jgi:hypothetical protein
MGPSLLSRCCIDRSCRDSNKVFSGSKTIDIQCLIILRLARINSIALGFSTMNIVAAYCQVNSKIKAYPKLSQDQSQGIFKEEACLTMCFFTYAVCTKRGIRIFRIPEVKNIFEGVG